MIHFDCDYAEGALERVLERLCATNMVQQPGYGKDDYCDAARQLFRKLCDAPNADVHFLVGGTQTNKIVIASILRPHQGVVCVESGHIAVHETGAIESNGHKVLTLPGHDGKLTANDIRDVCARHYSDPGRDLCVQPGLVYISQTTEVGTLYSLKELEEISGACHELGLPLFVDGARLGYGLAVEGNDVSLSDLARLSDVFYFGGTKIGALLGEAVIFSNPALSRDFRYIAKQNGGMLAKGRVLGLQFLALLEDDFYMQPCRRADEQGMRIRRFLEEKGIKMKYPSASNQQFPILPDRVISALSDRYIFAINERETPDSTVVRICTSWATRDDDVERLLADFDAVL